MESDAGVESASTNRVIGEVSQLRHLLVLWVQSVLPPPSASATLAFEISHLREGTWTETKHSSCCEVARGVALTM